MAMTLLTQIEKVAAYLAGSASVANGLDANIYMGRTNAVMELPLVVTMCETAEEFIYQSGIFRCNLLIQVQERAVDTSVSSSLGQAVYDAWDRVDLNTVLGTYSTGSICVFATEVKNLKTNVVTEDKTWLQELELNVIATLL